MESGSEREIRISVFSALRPKQSGVGGDAAGNSIVTVNVKEIEKECSSGGWEEEEDQVESNITLISSFGMSFSAIAFPFLPSELSSVSLSLYDE